jgi:uncharacterized protein (DUF362 family)
MPLSRRSFLGASVAAACCGAAPYFGLHPFIEANPKAVFIRRTRVPHKMDSPSKLAEGLQLAREIFVAKQEPGVPLTHTVLLKPNLTSVRGGNRPDEENWGTGTDPDFYEGLIIGLKELGIKKFHSVEANMYHSWNYRGFADINDRHSVKTNDPEQRLYSARDEREVVWSKIPDAVVYSRIPHFAPVNQPGTWLLNVAKWKAHSMCLTQSVKNEQGLVVLPFVRFCAGWRMVSGLPGPMSQDIAPNAEEKVKRYFENHRRMGYRRYESSVGGVSPIAQEIWAQKTCDNQSVLKTGLAMIEGIYGRDGDGFGNGNDYLTNYVLFSMDKFRLDVIGLWLGGHEPGNVHLYRIAKERGLSDTFNPWEIPVYEWTSEAPKARKLSDFSRTPLRSPYLLLGGEPPMHLADEPFDYDKYRT